MRPNRLFVLASLPIFTVAFVVVPAATSPAEQKAAEAAHGMVVSANVLASQVGVDMLKKGGNAVDAAAATGFALAVTYPGAGNIGGGGFFIIRLADGTAAALDFREKAPQRASRDMY
ncbi:MAG: gamma-glutamyltransferase, partial [Ignavibacteriales bacterium CG07_land_8_20_14_0_80_59_12]